MTRPDLEGTEVAPAGRAVKLRVRLGAGWRAIGGRSVGARFRARRSRAGPCIGPEAPTLDNALLQKRAGMRIFGGWRRP